MFGVDYVIHVNAAYRNGLAEGEAVDAAMARSLRIVGGALVLSFLTTVFGFLTNLTGPSALATFGILATIGIVRAHITPAHRAAARETLREPEAA